MDPSNLQETLKAIDDNILEKELDIARGKALAELKEDERFQLVFMQGYVDTESKKLFDILTDPSGASPYSMDKIHLMLEAVSHFKGFIGVPGYQGTVEQDAVYAVAEIAREREYRKQVTAQAAAEEV